MIKMIINNKDTYLPPFIIVLSHIFWLDNDISLIEFRFLQDKASCGYQSTIWFNIIEKKFDFVVSLLATGFFAVF